MPTQTFYHQTAIALITHDRMAENAEMLANLVRPPGNGIDSNHRIVGSLEDSPVAGQGLLPLQRQINLSVTGNFSHDDRQVYLVKPLFPDEPAKNPCCSRTFCQDHRAGSPAVKPVDRSQLARSAPPLHILFAMQHQIHTGIL